MLRLRELRKSKHMTQVELAEKAGISQPVVSGYETGEYMPSFDFLIRLAKALDCSLDELVDMSNEPTAS